VVGHDPVALLSQALDRVGMHCRIGALLNDTIGVWAAQRWAPGWGVFCGRQARNAQEPEPRDEATCLWACCAANQEHLHLAA